MTHEPTPGELRAWGWVRHLRDGGRTPWADWVQPGEPRGLFLPGAQQLELLRRLNERGGRFDADRVLEASAPGRGRPDLLLVGATEPSAFGPRPVDPGALCVDELLRVATGLIADDLLAADVPPEPPPPLTRPWRRQYRLVGDPWLADHWRERLRALGRPPGGANPRIVVLGGPVDDLLRHAYAARAFDGGCPPWPEWIATLAARHVFAPRLDLPAVAARWARSAGPDRVHIVLDPAAAPRLLGVRRLPAFDAPPAAAIELARRTAGVLGLLVAPQRRAEVLRRVLLPRLLAGGDGGPALAVPEEHRAWLAGRAVQMQARVRRAGYPVEGRLTDLAPALAPGATRVDGDAVLELAITLMTREVDA